MTDRGDIPFTLRPTCPKCGTDRFRYEYREYRGDESMRTVGEPVDPHLRVTCGWCGYAMTMRTRDQEVPR